MLVNLPMTLNGSPTDVTMKSAMARLAMKMFLLFLRFLLRTSARSTNKFPTVPRTAQLPAKDSTASSHDQERPCLCRILADVVTSTQRVTLHGVPVDDASRRRNNGENCGVRSIHRGFVTSEKSEIKHIM